MATGAMTDLKSQYQGAALAAHGKRNLASQGSPSQH
jgi:hypothetical protein